MSKKLIFLLISSFFLTTSCATISEKANDAYDSVAESVSKGYNSVSESVSKGYNKVKDTVTRDN